MGLLLKDFPSFINMLRKFNTDTILLSTNHILELSTALIMSFITYFSPSSGSNLESHIAFRCHGSLFSFNWEQIFSFVFHVIDNFEKYWSTVSKIVPQCEFFRCSLMIIFLLVRLLYKWYCVFLRDLTSRHTCLVSHSLVRLILITWLKCLVSPAFSFLNL